MNEGNEGQGTGAPGAVTPPKKKRTLPAALAKFKFQKGHKREAKPAPSPAPATPAASQSRRSVGVLAWMLGG